MLNVAMLNVVMLSVVMLSLEIENSLTAGDIFLTLNVDIFLLGLVSLKLSESL
jgi:hypothetical protein